jgi:hypothetical protein
MPEPSSPLPAGAPPRDSAYIAAVWEHPFLCLAFFGVQYQTEEGQRLYQAAGIEAEMFPALGAAAQVEGLLLTRPMMTDEGPLLMQYWRSYEDLDRWAHKMPHTRWWKWLVENTGKGVAFYHEIYQAKTGEAIFEEGARPVGPALFSSLHAVKSGEGRSRQRQQHFADVAATATTTASAATSET